MKASKFSDAQKAFVLKQGVDGIPAAEICRRAGISQATYFNWKKKYDGLLPTEMKRLSSLRTRTASCGSWSQTCLSTRICCRTSFAENCEAWLQTRAGGAEVW